MKFLTPPTSNYTDFYAQGKFKLTWYIYIIFFFLTFILSIIHFIGDSDLFIYTFIGLFVSTLALIILYTTKKYHLVAIGTIIFSSSINQLMIYEQINTDRLINLIWIINLSLYAFYVLNYYWGILCLLINFGLIVFWQYYFNYDKIYYTPVNSLALGDQIDYFLNMFIGILIISYLIIRFIKENNHATNQYIVANYELNKTNTIVSQQNDEKTVMLKEIHHRVKNNLQIITSLLRLQSRELKEPEAIQHFNDATNRIVAMSLIHDKMYQSDNLSKINILNYLNDLIDDLIRSYSVNIPIKKTFESDIKLVSSKSLVSIALIFNELVSNSLKHAFKTSEKGIIEIYIKLTDTNTIITYYDNGVWLEKQKVHSFGTELIDTLIEQLDGELTKTTKEGTKYTIILPKNL